MIELQTSNENALIWRQICLWETLTKKFDEHLNSLRFMCIELSASSENAFKLYNFLNKGERKHIKVNGILLDKIKEKYSRTDKSLF